MALPTPATSFLGREAELTEAHDLLSQTRLLTVTGPGGVGKTRFALELARRAVENGGGYADGAYASLLAPLRDPSLVLPTLARTLDVHEQPGATALQTLSSYLGGRRVLLLVDNLEHLGPSRDDLSALATACPGLALLLTSREPVHAPGERVYLLPPLREEEGVALFCERAQIAPSRAVRELCARLEGLPLAIELAAARTRLLAPAQIVERLAHRLELLKGVGDADLRHETLRGTIQWSYDLLSAEEQEVFARLSVFVGGCTTESATEVARAEPEVLDSLVDKSLLRRSETELGQRFSMLETIREYALERLEELRLGEEQRLRHADHFLGLAERAEEELEVARRPAVLEALEAERANLRQARAWLRATGRHEPGLRLVAALRNWLYTRGPYDEGRVWFQEALEGAGETAPELRTRLLMGAGLLAYRQQDAQAEVYWTEAADLFRRLGDPLHLAVMLSNLGFVAANRGDYERAEALYAESTAILSEGGDTVRLARALNGLGIADLLAGKPIEARAHFEESLQVATEVGDIQVCSIAFLNLGLCALQTGDAEEARRLFTESLGPAHEVGDVGLCSYCLEAFAALDATAGDAVRAARLLACADALLEGEGGSRERFFEEMRARTVSVLERVLGPDGLVDECTRGGSMTLEAGISLALEPSEELGRGGP